MDGQLIHHLVSMIAILIDNIELLSLHCTQKCIVSKVYVIEAGKGCEC